MNTKFVGIVSHCPMDQLREVSIEQETYTNHGDDSSGAV